LNKYYTLGEYNKLLRNKKRTPWKDEWNVIEGWVKKGERIVERMMPFFSYEQFKEQFFNTKTFDVVTEKTSLIFIRDFVRQKYLKNNNLPMSVKISDSVASLLKFTGTSDLPMRAITSELCQRYEDYMYKKSRTKTRNGAGINMRHIRILFNEGIRNRFIPQEWYPFRRESGELSCFERPYTIPNEQKVKVYFKEDEFLKFAKAEKFTSPVLEERHAAFMISFYCNGANAADFLRFKFGDIHGDFIVFYREKIKNASKSNKKPIKIYLSADLKNLIHKIGNPQQPNNYIFKCYTDDMSEEEKYKARCRFNRVVSKSLKKITKDLNLEKNISIGKARHTLTNILKKHQVNREFVKDILGHTSIVTADNYYGQFEDEQHTSIFDNIVSLQKIGQRLEP
jgi:integrase